MGQYFPEAVRQLTMTFDIAFDEDIRVCPQCGTAYHFQFVTDNDIFQPTHTGEYSRISAEQAKEMIDWQNQLREHHKKRLEIEKRRYKIAYRKKYEQLFQTLSEIEKQIFDYFAEQKYQVTSHANLQKELSLDVEIMNAALDHLVQLKILYRFSDGKYSIN